MEAERIISVEDAERILEPYVERLALCVQAGWEAWEELGRMAPRSRVPLRPHTRASFVYDHAVQRAREEFADDHPRVRIMEKNQLLTLTFEDRLVVRFKKFRDGVNFRTSGITTMQQQLYAYQLPLPGMPHEATKLVTGYVLDELQASIETVAIACSDGSRLEWFLDITDAGGADGSVVEPIQPPQPSGPRIKPKPSAEPGLDEASESR
ncbi:MAG: hypothetical protein M3P49_04600 [Actinomycetota bacterium]|nr:hypothetical protein [Actinomycetota bacterium]